MSDLDTYWRTLESTLAGEPCSALPAPWLGWLIVCLCRQRARQSWLREVAETRLAEVDSDTGSVPGLPEWSFEFHGMGLCLSGPGGEHIDVDFHDEQAATIDPYFFAGRVLRLDPPPPPERRVGELFADARSVSFALKALRAAGVLVHESSDHVFRLAEPIEALHPRVAEVDFEDPQMLAQWCRALGDGPSTASRFARWLEECCRDRVVARELATTVEKRLPAQLAQRIFLRLLPGPIDATTGYAVEALHRLDSEVESVLSLLDRLDPSRQHPFTAHAVCRFLLDRGMARERALAMAERFASVEQVPGYNGNPYEDRLSLLLLEHDPPRALRYVRSALRSSTPAVVQRVAATLAIVGQVWCVRELTAALADRGLDDSNRRYLAAALKASGSERAARSAEELSPPPPVHEGPGYSFDEVVFANLEAFFGTALDEARPLAEKLRAQLADDYGAHEVA